MLKKIQDALVDEARHRLAVIEGAKDPIEIAIRFARYSQTIDILRILGRVFYPKDRESSEAYKKNANLLIESLEKDHILEKGGEEEPLIS
jgi:hypothetical protein